MYLEWKKGTIIGFQKLAYSKVLYICTLKPLKDKYYVQKAVLFFLRTYSSPSFGQLIRYERSFLDTSS